MSLISKKSISDPLLIQIKHIYVNLTPTEQKWDRRGFINRDSENEVFEALQLILSEIACKNR